MTDLEKLNDQVNNALTIIYGEARKAEAFGYTTDRIKAQVAKAAKALKEYTKKNRARIEVLEAENKRLKDIADNSIAEVLDSASCGFSGDIEDVAS